MALHPVAATRLEKAAVDNGFDLDRGREGDWLVFDSSQTDLRVWLTAPGESPFLAAFSRADVLAALARLGEESASPLPEDAAGARSAGDIPALHRLVRRSFQLSRALPDGPLKVFRRRIADLPTSTEAERLVVRRVGQDVFRDGLLDYWEARCAITGLAVPALLRASHIKPWAHCAEDAVSRRLLRKRIQPVRPINRSLIHLQPPKRAGTGRIHNRHDSDLALQPPRTSRWSSGARWPLIRRSRPVPLPHFLTALLIKLVKRNIRSTNFSIRLVKRVPR